MTDNEELACQNAASIYAKLMRGKAIVTYQAEHSDLGKRMIAQRETVKNGENNHD